MAKLRSLSQRRAVSLNVRRRLENEIPEWVVRLLRYRMEEANDGAELSQRVELNDVIEWCLVCPLTVREVPIIEQRIPGIATALSEWLETSIYEPPSPGV